MIKVKKICFQNFKGVKPKTVFDFDQADSCVNILSGPNGFGKTTVFDVIEFCLTGEFKRIEIFDHVQKKNNHKNKPFFQNTDGEDVVLKLWLYDSQTTSDHIIIKYYDDDQSPTKKDHGRDFIPADAGNIFYTFHSTDSRHFLADDISQLIPVDQKEINNLIYGQESVVDIRSIYYLFNYIQQEDSIYFLRKNEDEKGASLGFLFNIEKEEAEKQKLLQLKTSLQRQSSGIEQQLSQLRQSLPEAQKGDYFRLFPLREFDFDKENPFGNLNTARDQMTFFLDLLAKLTLLKNNFSPDEYEKSLRYQKLNEEVLANPAILDALLIRNVYAENLTADLEKENIKITKAKTFLQLSSNVFISKEYFDLFLEDPAEYTRYSVIEDGIRAIDSDLGEVGRIISEINSDRKRILDLFAVIKSTVHISSTSCPLCNTNFESYESLLEAVRNKSALLEVFNSEKLNQKSRFEALVKEFHEKVSTSATAFLTASKLTEQGILTLLRSYPALRGKVEEIVNSYAILTTGEIQEIYFTKPPVTFQEVIERRNLLKSFLEKNLLTELLFDERLIENKELYIQYFDSDRAVFNSITTEMIANKAQYVSGLYAQLANSKLTFLEARLRKLTDLLTKANSVYEKVHRTIQDHKAEMIEDIKVPFYIYSGKILQSYQQGLGIFVEIHSTGLSNNVRFKTGNSSDHDIVYHLSSGQMAVVSLAFCLSLNRVYNTNDRFKFLSIDDPIQTMDDLNIHTFIELVRNEFKEYQIIISTHDDFMARYMKYKFDKFDMITTIQNVQNTVLRSLTEIN